MHVLNGDDIRHLITIADLIDPIADAMIAASRREASLPLRQVIELEGGNRFGVMPGANRLGHGAKLISLFPGNPARGLSSHAGVMVLFDPQSGLPRACLDAGVLTALRTAAASAVATRSLARAQSNRLAIIGAGEQAEAHLEVMRQIRPITETVVWSRSRAKTEAFAGKHGIEAAASLEEAVARADIVCTATAATKAFLAAGLLPKGVHLNAVGASVPFMRELEPDCATALTLFTDYRPSLEAQAGEVIDARAMGLLPPERQATEIGEVLSGGRPGRVTDEERTLYRSLGIAAQDLAAADFIVARAKETKVGTDIAWS